MLQVISIVNMLLLRLRFAKLARPTCLLIKTEMNAMHFEEENYQLNSGNQLM